MFNWLKSLFGGSQTKTENTVPAPAPEVVTLPPVQISVPIPTSLDVNKDGKVDEQDLVAATEKVAEKAKKNVTKAADKAAAKVTKNVKKAISKSSSK